MSISNHELMTASEEKYFKANKECWNGRVSFHKDSSFYDVAGFKKGKNVLNDIELSELGDVSGKSMLHLQCHFGLDTMSWSRLGAQATGVDFSEEAILVAKDLSKDLGLKKIKNIFVHQSPTKPFSRIMIILL